MSDLARSRRTPHDRIATASPKAMREALRFVVEELWLDYDPRRPPAERDAWNPDKTWCMQTLDAIAGYLSAFRPADELDR